MLVALPILGMAFIIAFSGSLYLRDQHPAIPDIDPVASDDTPQISSPTTRQLLDATPTETIDEASRFVPEGVLVASIAPPEIQHRLQPWIDVDLLVERPYIDSYVVLKIDNQPIIDSLDRIAIQIAPDTTYVASKTFRQSLPVGGPMWGGKIEGLEYGTVSIEVSANGESVFSIRTGTEIGLIMIRPTPILPYHIAYTRDSTPVLLNY